MEELKKQFKEITFTQEYDKDTFVVSVFKEDLINFLKDKLNIENLKIV